MIHNVIRLSKKIGLPIYYRLPRGMQVVTTQAYRKVRRVIRKPIAISVRQISVNDSAKLALEVASNKEVTAPTANSMDGRELIAAARLADPSGIQDNTSHSSEVESIDDLPASQCTPLPSFDIQNIVEFLGKPTKFTLTSGENDWLKLTEPVVVQLLCTDCYEIQFGFTVRSNDLNVKSSDINITPIYDGIDTHSNECDISLSEGIISFRIHPPRNCTNIAIRLESTSSNVDVHNQYNMIAVRRGISVVVGVYKEEDVISNVLESFSRQDADKSEFEIIFVVNGPKDQSEQIIAEWIVDNSDINASLFYEQIPSLSNARNVGVRYSSFSHVTFVDADDTLSQSYLASMLERITIQSIVCSNIVNVSEDGALDVYNYANASILALKDKSAFAPQDASNISTMSACKAIPSYMVRCVPFLVHLKNGEDTPFYCEIYARFPQLKLNADSDPERCVYFRLMRSGSLSRRSLDYEFHILDRLSVIKEISHAASLPQKDDIRRFNFAKMSGQIGFMAEYLRAYPEKYLEVVREIQNYNIPNFPLDLLKDRSSTQLVIAYCFPPFQDASSIVMAKRIYEAGVLCDVISNDIANVRAEDNRLLQPIKPFIAKHAILNSPVSFSSWPAIQKFAELTVAKADQIQLARKRPYQRMYSRAQWVSSHFAAIQFKLKYPDIHWTAEFSDPLLYGVNGDIRPGKIDPKWLQSSGLLNRLSELGVSFNSEETNLFYWCELATIHLADELVFTNLNQLKYMRGYLPSSQDRSVVNRKATVSAHPVARGWLSNPDRANEPSFYNLNLAYFGSFYVNRGVGELLSALRNLTEKQRSRTRFYIYSREYKEAVAEAEYLGISDIIICKPELPYADMISELTKFDLLVVNDARVPEGKLNPFLPSKLSDYRQSDVPILAIYQPGSSLSKLKDVEYRVSANLPKEKFESAIRSTLKKASEDKRARLLAH
ncbi:glycosyltransferase [Ochrobactrum sp. MYb379]|uniref:glycosyltransferase n=1 Tax=Ochrobactrum sp. MYb379 TaxID=2745275 RepID=UPI003097C15A